MANLAKLEIVAQKKDKEGKLSDDSAVAPFVVLYNPQSYSEEYKNSYEDHTPSGASDKVLKFKQAEGQSITFELLWDATATSFSGPEGEEIARVKKDKRVDTSIKEFLNRFYYVKGEAHEPSFLKVHWGDKTFQGVLETAQVTYSLFNLQGYPIRAKMNVKFTSHESLQAQAAAVRRNSPDLTHVRTVESHKSLGLMCHDIYQNDKLYLEVAAANQLNHFRKLKQGTSLIFPPIEKQ
ncbi:MAG: hypothetical protein JNL57_12835 [Bacteroidetes bacterium]|nr:hypothetical protein [Bacteroidota bacterium]